MAWNFRLTLSHEVGVDRDEFDQAVERLKKAGYSCQPEDKAWEHFSRTRAKYASALNLLAGRFAIIPAQWIGDRSYLPHRSGRGRRRIVR